ncbi:MAG: membrane protein insertase YidC [Oscillibacter sp.]|nr:membrane protein insertase YidC [Oscillibacter sp.]
MFSSIGYVICIPFALLVKLFYNMTGSYGVAIILFTVAVKLILLPFQIKSKKSMIRMNRMQGRMQDLQKKYANNQMKLNEEMQKLYAEEGVNPMGGCLWSFLPLPIMIALYSIIRQPITRFMMLGEDVLYKAIEAAKAAGANMATIVQVAEDGAMKLDKTGLPLVQPYGEINLVKVLPEIAPEFCESVEGWMSLNYSFLGLDLASTPWEVVTSFALNAAFFGMLLIPIITGLSQLVMTMYTMKNQPSNAGNASMKMMMYTMPLMTVYFAFVMPAALGVYWIAQSIFSLIQEVFMTKIFNKKIEEEENARYEAIQADRQRRIEEGKRLQEERKNQQVQKQTLREKQKAAQVAKAEKAKKAASSTTEAGRVGDRPYARGRAYKENRYDD